jgi:hypothetical protein
VSNRDGRARAVSLENSEIPTNVPTPVARVGRRGALTRRQKAAVIVRLLVNEDMQPDLARLTEAQQTEL